MATEQTAVICPICKSASHYNFSSRDLMFDHYERYDYFSCSECQAVFQHPMPSDEQINSFYPADYSVFDAKIKIRKISQFKQAIYKQKYNYKHLSPSKSYQLLATLVAPIYNLDKPDYIENGTLLDVGCANGRYLSSMRQLGWKVQGVELSENGIEVCNALDLPVHHGDIISANFADNSFDVITVRHVIEHISQPHIFMAELARVLKPGGRLILETPNSNALGRAYLGANWYANEVPRHLILFRSENLSRLAAQYNLTVAQLHFGTTPKIFLNSLDYITKNKGKRSKKVAWKRFCSRLYIWAARLTKREDVMHLILTKQI